MRGGRFGIATGVPDFRPRLVPTLALLGVLGVTVNLGRWQLRRDVERNALRERMITQEGKPAATAQELAGGVEGLLGRAVRLEGTFEGPALLEEGRPGPSGPEYGIFHAFRSGSVVILVDRGSTPDPAVLPEPAAEVEGMLVPLSPGTTGGARGRFPPGSGEAMRAATPGAVDALVVTGEAARVPARDDTSRYYAIQWFLIGAAAVGLWGWAALRRGSGRG